MCSADKNRKNAAFREVTGFKLETVIRSFSCGFVARLCRTGAKESEGYLPRYRSGGNAGPTPEQDGRATRESRRILRNHRARRFRSGKLENAEAGFYSKYANRSHLLEAVKRECTDVHPHFNDPSLSPRGLSDPP